MASSPSQKLLYLAALALALPGCAHCMQSPDACAVWIDSGPPLICGGLLDGLTNCGAALANDDLHSAHPQPVAVENHPPEQTEKLSVIEPPNSMRMARRTAPSGIRRLQHQDTADGANQTTGEPEALPIPEPTDSPDDAGSSHSAPRSLHTNDEAKPAHGHREPSALAAGACDCGQDCQFNCPVCPFEHCRRLKDCPLLKQPELGPPPIPYRPPAPPKFLPVPTRSVQTGVSLGAPTFQRGAVELGFEPEIRIQSRD